MDTKAIDDNSGHVSKFFKLSPDSISKFNKEENLVKKMNQDICEITEKITEKMSKINDLNSKMLRLSNSNEERRYREARNEKLQRELYMTLDELNIMSKANGEWFQEKLDKNSLDYLKLHGSKSLAEEKQILRDLKIQQKDVASFKSPSQLLINSSFAYTIHKKFEEKLQVNSPGRAQSECRASRGREHQIGYLIHSPERAATRQGEYQLARASEGGSKLTYDVAETF